MTGCKECGAAVTDEAECCSSCEARARNYWKKRFETLSSSPEVRAENKRIVAQYVLKQPHRFTEKVLAWAEETLQPQGGVQHGSRASRHPNGQVRASQGIEARRQRS